MLSELLDTVRFSSLEADSNDKFKGWVHEWLGLADDDLTDVGIYVGQEGEVTAGCYSQSLSVSWQMKNIEDRWEFELYPGRVKDEWANQGTELLDTVGQVLTEARWRGGNVLPILQQQKGLFASLGIRLGEVLNDNGWVQVVSLSQRGKGRALKIVGPPDVALGGRNATFEALALHIFARWLAAGDRHITAAERPLTVAQEVNIRGLVSIMTNGWATVLPFLPREWKGGVNIGDFSGLVLPRGQEIAGDKPFEVRFSRPDRLFIIDGVTTGNSRILAQGGDTVMEIGKRAGVLVPSLKIR